MRLASRRISRENYLLNAADYLPKERLSILAAFELIMTAIIVQKRALVTASPVILSGSVATGRVNRSGIMGRDQ
jgi:hypothetical protein